ncbi:MAG: CPBP family intramembrane metalloprotease [Tissierellales bacterium]|nr:CPBP family intramembrane metalloprotease [Tissierellales bacterium]MBN2828455.1 CPBP family intramembrane metalloprotease [Tissierellales bacterium]
MGTWDINKRTKSYLITAFLWTWSGWIGAYALSQIMGTTLSLNGTLFSLWTWAWDRSIIPQILFSLAVYGPLVGAWAVRAINLDLFKNGNAPEMWRLVILIPILSIFPAVILSFATSYFDTQSCSFLALLTAVTTYFASNLLTSGTEEFGWRGFLYPQMKASGMSFWDIAWKGGFVWALWHFPLLFIMYMPMGLMILLPSLVGFTASIVAMNFISNFLYDKMKIIWPLVVLHALNNTMSFTLVLLFPGTPFTIFTSIMAWVVVWWIEKKYPEVHY